jgi:hypothetical protein
MKWTNILPSCGKSVLHTSRHHSPTLMNLGPQPAEPPGWLCPRGSLHCSGEGGPVGPVGRAGASEDSWQACQNLDRGTGGAGGLQHGRVRAGQQP